MIDFADVADLGAARMIVAALNAEIRALQDELRETRAQLPEGYADAERPHLRVRADRIMAAAVQTAEQGLVS